MEETKKRTAVLCGSVVCIAAVTFLAGAVRYIGAPWLRVTALVAANLLNGLTALAAMRLTGMKIDIDLKNWRQYFTGAALALSLSLVIAVIPALCGVCLVGRHTDFTWGKLVYNLLFYLLIVGPVEEFIFRVYLQDVFVGLFKSSGWLGVIAADALFGLWHIINGNLLQALFTFAIGLVFGFARYDVKDCGYVGAALGHGLYDFLNTLVTMFLI